jgi:hypothetical protein
MKYYAIDDPGKEFKNNWALNVRENAHGNLEIEMFTSVKSNEYVCSKFDNIKRKLKKFSRK